MFLVNQKDICFASIADGVISVVTTGVNGMEGQSNCRTLEELLESLDPDLFWRAQSARVLCDVLPRAAFSKGRRSSIN